MSEENVEIVRRAYAFHSAGAEAFARAEHIAADDILALPGWELWHPDAVLEELAEVPDAAVYRGIDEIARYLVQLADAWEAIRWEPKELVDLGDDVAVVAEAVGVSKQGVPARMEVVQLWSLRDGKIARVRAFTEMGSALKAAGLSE